jgi:hypothetical protein
LWWGAYLLGTPLDRPLGTSLGLILLQMNPSIHPVSSHLQQWVLGFSSWSEWGGVAGLQLPNPPSGQLLTMVGGGAHCCCCWHHPGGVHPHCHLWLGSSMAVSTAIHPGSSGLQQWWWVLGLLSGVSCFSRWVAG